MLFILFLIIFNHGCAEKFGNNCIRLFEFVFCVFFYFANSFWWIKDVYNTRISTIFFISVCRNATNAQISTLKSSSPNSPNSDSTDSHSESPNFTSDYVLSYKSGETTAQNAQDTDMKRGRPRTRSREIVQVRRRRRRWRRSPGDGDLTDSLQKHRRSPAKFHTFTHRDPLITIVVVVVVVAVVVTTTTHFIPPQSRNFRDSGNTGHLQNEPGL